MADRFSTFLDSPGRINSESKDVSLVFQRTSDTTGLLTWNIPPPSAGCDAKSQAYNGIVLTVSSQPANYLSTSPKNGTYYKADTSVNPEIHCADKCDIAMVVGAFYDDRTTTCLTVTDLEPLTSYYFSAYPVDNVCRYYREGVHSYSLPTGPETPNKEKDLSAIQDIGIDSSQTITPETFTGLQQGTAYYITVIVSGKKYRLLIDGTLALDYDDLVYEINKQFKILTEPKYTGPNPPNYNNYYVDIDEKSVSLWNGYVYTVETALFQQNDPSTPINGTFWYDTTNNSLYIYVNRWRFNAFISSNYDFSNPQCYQFWFDGTNVYQWMKTVWMQLPTYVSDTNPLLPQMLDCGSYWYNTNTNLLYQWDIQLNAWNTTNAIYYDLDPTTITSGAYWYNQTDEMVYYYAASKWNQLTVNFSEPDDNGNFVGTTYANMYWFVQSTQTLYRRDAANTVWVQLDVIIYNTDPTIRESGQLWWKASTDDLYIWDIVNNKWMIVSAFYNQSLDPSTPQDIPLNSAWYNPSNNVLTIINNPDCTQVGFVTNSTDPTIMNINEIWFNTLNNEWYQWNGSGWSEISVINAASDPYVLSYGNLWFNTASLELNQWDSGWNIIPYSTDSLIPKTNSLWYNPVDENMYEWKNNTWGGTIGVAAVKLVLRNEFRCDTCKSDSYQYWNLNDGWAVKWHGDFLRFYTKDKGNSVTFKLCYDDGQEMVFAQLTQGIAYFKPERGYTAQSSGPMYQQIGVGDSGVPDVRRDFHKIIRSSLGDPVFKVELTKDDIDICIDNALKMLRKYSNLAYLRAFFFLDVYPNQQQYILKDEVVGFNKIVDINAIYRTRASFFGANGFSGDGMFAWSALTQLYSLGTFDMLSFHMVSSYIKDLQVLFADYIMYHWNEENRMLRVYKTFYGCERVLIDGTIERSDQFLLIFRETTMWLQKWALAEAKIMLAQSRGKFVILPGPNGNTTLNAQDLIQQSQQEMEKLMEELYNPAMQSFQEAGMRGAGLIIG